MAMKHKPVLAVETVAIASLVPHPRNPRIHPESALARLAQSIETYGWTNPVLVDKDNRVLAGHARLKAAERLGITEVPVIRLPLTGKKADAYLIADNHLSELTEWDLAGLESLMADLDLIMTGFDADTLERLLKNDVPWEDMQASGDDSDDATGQSKLIITVPDVHFNALKREIMPICEKYRARTT